MKVPQWLCRVILRWHRDDCHKLAFKISAMGQDNGNPQTFLNAAKDNLYAAAREFDLLSEKRGTNGPR
jgi:hypothetical protein